MNEFNISINGGSSVRLPVAGKYCDRDIVVTANGSAGGGSGGDERLPDGYTKVDYIQFTGEQIVDTCMICNQDTEIRVIHTRDSSASMYLYGVASDENTASVTAYLASGGSWRFGNKYASRSIGADPDMLRTAVVSKTGVTHETGTSGYAASDFETIGTLLIGTCRSASGAVAAAQFEGKVLLFEMRQNDVLALKYIPAFDADGVFGFYETVKGEFHTSITDVPFTGGYL